jgi:transposase, IS5 family
LQDIDVKPMTAVVDLGFRGVEVDAEIVPAQTVHGGRYKTLKKQQRRWLKRHQAVEPAISHLKHDHRMDRCWLRGSIGDAPHAVLCAAGFNIRWRLRAIARRGLAAVLFALYCLALRVARSWFAVSDRRTNAQHPLTRTAHRPLAVSM